jgi:hypothetical protein
VVNFGSKRTSPTVFVLLIGSTLAVCDDPWEAVVLSAEICATHSLLKQRNLSELVGKAFEVGIGV